MNRHFYLVFNPFLDSSDEEYTQAHQFYFDLKKRKQENSKSTMFWGKITKSKKKPLSIKDFKATQIKNTDTHLFISDYKNLWVGKVKSIQKEKPIKGKYDPMYDQHKVEVWFEIEDFTILENSQKNCADRIANFNCFQGDLLVAEGLTSYLSGLRFPLQVEDTKNELFFNNDRVEVLQDSPLIKNNVSQKVIQSLTSYCIPEDVFKELPHSAKEEIIKAEIELLDNKIYNLNSITFSYLKALECVINDVFKKALSRSTAYNKIWYSKKDKVLRAQRQNDFDISVMEITTNYSLITIFKFLKDGHRTKCSTTKEIFSSCPKLEFFLGKELNDISYQLDLINLRNKLAHDSDYNIEYSTFYSIRSAIIGHAQAGLINKAYKSYNRALFKSVLPNNFKKAA